MSDVDMTSTPERRKKYAIRIRQHSDTALIELHRMGVDAIAENEGQSHLSPVGFARLRMERDVEYAEMRRRRLKP
jgi:hypothetical protein